MWVCVCSHGVQHQIKNDHTHEHAHIQQRGANTHMNTSMQIDIIHAPKFVHNPKITHEYTYILNAPDLWMQYTPGMVIADRYAIYIHVCSNPLSLAWRKRSSWSTATVKTDNNLRHLNIWALARMQLCHSEDMQPAIPGTKCLVPDRHAAKSHASPRTCTFGCGQRSKPHLVRSRRTSHRTAAPRSLTPRGRDCSFVWILPLAIILVSGSKKAFSWRKRKRSRGERAFSWRKQRVKSHYEREPCCKPQQAKA